MNNLQMGALQKILKGLKICVHMKGGHFLTGIYEKTENKVLFLIPLQDNITDFKYYINIHKITRITQFI
jgi:hypothetical protein